MVIGIVIVIAKTKENIYLIKMGETKPSAPLLYPNISSLPEQYINDKILANNKFNDNINNIKIEKKLL